MDGRPQTFSENRTRAPSPSAEGKIQRRVRFISAACQTSQLDQALRIKWNVNFGIDINVDENTDVASD